MSLRSEAIDIALFGWRVHPLHPRDKRPTLGAWQKKATTDIDEAGKWWDASPDANVAIATGHGLMVIDIDGPAGLASIEVLENTHAELPETPTVITRNGLHLYYSVPLDYDGVTNKSQLGDGIDVRATGGYVVAPPSIHPDGGQYRWSTDQSPWDIPVATAPDWLQRLCRRPEKLPALPVGVSIPSRTSNDDIETLTIAKHGPFIQRLISDGWAVEQESADQIGIRRPGKHEHGISAVLHRDALLVIFSTACDPRLYKNKASGGDGWTLTYFEYIAITQHDGDQSAAGRDIRYGGEAELMSMFDSLPEKAQTAPPVELPPDHRSDHLVDLTPFLDGTWEPPEADWLHTDIGTGLFYRGQLNWIHGESGSGKTWAALVGAAESVLNGLPVVWIHYEDPTPMTIVGRLLQLGCTVEQINENFLYWAPHGLGLMDPVQLAELLALCAERKPDMIIIDSIGEAMGADAVDEDRDYLVGPWITTVLRTLVDAGHGVVGIDHSTKNGAENLDLNPSGSKRKRAAVTGLAVLVRARVPITRADGGTLELIVGKDRHGNFAKGVTAATIRLVARTDGTLGYLVEADRRALPEEVPEVSPEDALDARLKHELEDKGATHEKALYLSLKADRDDVDLALARMKKAGLVAYAVKGMNKVWSLTDQSGMF